MWLWLTRLFRAEGGCLRPVKNGAKSSRPNGLSSAFSRCCKVDVQRNHSSGSGAVNVFLLLRLYSLSHLRLLPEAVVPFSPKLILANVNAGVLYLFAMGSLDIWYLVSGLVFELKIRVVRHASFNGAGSVI